MKKRTVFIVLLCLLSTSVYSFVISQTEQGDHIRWNQFEKEIYIDIDPSVVKEDFILDISENTLAQNQMSVSEYLKKRNSEIIFQSINQWNKHIPYRLIPRINERLESVSGASHTIRFTDDVDYFGAGIIAVTKIQYDAQNGNILSSDILLNQSVNNIIKFTLDKSLSSRENAYLGDVVSHELGHLLGLAHSEVIGSTMVYSIFKDQHTLHEDDIHGVHKNYLVSEKDGLIKGKIVAGNLSQGAFGIHVQLFSLKKNKVVQGKITDPTGLFQFENLSVDDTYSLLVSPLKNKETISSRYKNTNNLLCQAGRFPASFFSQCGPRHKSRPQLLSFKEQSSVLDIGNVTIRCDENMNTTYFSHKFENDETFYSLLSNEQSLFLFNGLFTASEMKQEDNGKGDYYQLDLTRFEQVSHENLVYRLKFNTSGIGSGYQLSVFVKREGDSQWSKFQSRLDNIGKLVTDFSLDLDLLPDSSKNKFYLKVYPLKISAQEQYGIFSAASELLNKNHHYLVSGGLGKLDGVNFILLENQNLENLEDNSSCVEGDQTFSGKSYYIDNSAGGSQGPSVPTSSGVSCGTANFDHQSNTGGGASFFFGLLMSFMVFQICFKLRSE